ncbi:DNRLRE domain-containing protein [Streptomyces sp. NPDC051286]|uniref:DNRLRE domain-containing protein n=1 Tax=Streptomyces sp. NPDC051286 TaxID=3365647 RepID=UPI0037A8FFA0
MAVTAVQRRGPVVRGDNDDLEGLALSAGVHRLRRGCSTTGAGVEAQRITQNWDPSSVTWGAQPATTATGAAVSKASYGYSSACPANFMRWNVTGIAQA